jgi:hypothetical protein
MQENERVDFPLDIYQNKKFVVKSIFISVGGILFCTLGFLLAEGDIFNSDYYFPQAMIICTLGAAASLFLTLKHLLLLFEKAPIITLTQEGLQIHKKPYQALGTISWKEIREYKEFAFNNQYNKHGRRLCFAAKNLTSLVNKITDLNKRKKLENAFKKNKNWLFCVTLNELEYEPEELKKLIAFLIVKNKEVPTPNC